MAEMPVLGTQALSFHLAGGSISFGKDLLSKSYATCNTGGKCILTSIFQMRDNILVYRPVGSEPQEKP